MTLHECINWFLIIWLGLFGGCCLDSVTKRWLGERWSLKSQLLITGISAAGVVLFLRMSGSGFPNWFYRLAELLEKVR